MPSDICLIHNSIIFDPCDCYKYYNGGTQMPCAKGTYSSIHNECESVNPNSCPNPWKRCGVNNKFNLKRCREIWPKDFRNWDNDKIRKFKKKYVIPEQTTPGNTIQPTAGNTEQTTPDKDIPLTLIIALLSIFLVLAVLVIIFLYRKSKRKTTSATTEPTTQLKEERVEADSEIYAEIDETKIYSNNFISNGGYSEQELSHYGGEYGEPGPSHYDHFENIILSVDYSHPFQKECENPCNVLEGEYETPYDAIRRPEPESSSSEIK